MAARHLLLARNGEWCYVMFRKDRRKGLPLFASILHVSRPRVLRAMAGPLARHLLLRHGLARHACRARRRRAPSAAVAHHRLAVGRKMFRSPNLEPAQIDYLYSELVRLSW